GGAGDQPHVSDSDYETYRQTQAVLVKSRLVLNAALRNPKVANLPLLLQQKDPVAWLKDAIQVDFLDKTEIMRISIAGKPSEELATLVTAVTDAYLQEIVNKEQTQRLLRLDDLRALTSQYEEKLRSKRQAMRA